MAEWFKAHAWKACVANPYRGFESLSLRQLYFTEPIARFSKKVWQFPGYDNSFRSSFIYLSLAFKASDADVKVLLASWVVATGKTARKAGGKMD